MESDWTWDRLDPLERRVADLLLQGKSNAAICAEVFLSRARVQECINRILIKTRTRTARSAIVRLTEERETQSLLSVLDQASDGVVVIQDRVLKFINRAMARACGYDVSEMVGMPLVELVVSEHREKVANRYELRMQGGRVPIGDSIRIQLKQGQGRDARVTSAGLIRYMGRPAIMAVAVWQD